MPQNFWEMMMTTNDRPVKFSTWCGSLRLQQHGVDSTSTLDVRRVHPNGGCEHVQIALTTERHHKTRTVSGYGHIELRPEDVAFLITALTKVLPNDPDRMA